MDFCLLSHQLEYLLCIAAKPTCWTLSPVRSCTTPLRDIKAPLSFLKTNTSFNSFKHVKIAFFFCYCFSKLKDTLPRQRCGIKMDSVFYCLCSVSVKKGDSTSIICFRVLLLPAQKPEITMLPWTELKSSRRWHCSRARHPVEEMANCLSFHQLQKCWQELTVVFNIPTPWKICSH